MKKYYISSSEKGMSIVFGSEQDYNNYTQEVKDLVIKYKKLQQESFGYWASNQDKFVKSPDDLNGYDIREYIV